MHQLRGWCGDLWQWSKRQKLLFLVFVAVGIFATLHIVKAEDIMVKIGGVIGSILSWVIELLGKLIVICTDILIQLASYNDFVHAAPVNIGWTLTRDVANMFFIVLLLVSAFSTIIRYKEFHYSQVLPKLLVMAVLINFSKTFCGLLIDFSQVVMLTFVNAFRQAAAGNMVSALHLNQIMAIDSKTKVPGEGVEDKYAMGSLIVAALLGVVMLSLALTVIIIMMIYIIARIVAIWLIIIISPLVFFSGAVPGKLRSALAPLTGAWGKFSGLLVGGPVMAFFLWLTLAVVQSNPDDFKRMYKASDETTKASQSADFATIVGNAGDISSFAVAIVMLMAGVQFAVQTASTAAPVAGKLAGMLAAGGALGVVGHALRGGTRVARKTAQVGGKVAGKVGGAAFEGVDRLTNLRGGIGKIGLKASAALGGIGGETFNAMAGYRGKRQKEAGGTLEKKMAGRSTEDKMGFLQGIKDSPLSNQYQKAAAAASLAGFATSSLGMKALEKQADAKLEGKGLTGANRQAAAGAAANERASDMLKAGMDNAIANGDDAQLEKYKATLENNPQFNKDWTDFSARKHAVVNKPNEFIQHIKSGAHKDSRNFLADAHALGLVDEKTGKFDESDGKKEIWDQLKRGDNGGFIGEHMKNLTSTQITAQLGAMDSSAAKVTDAANASRRYATKDKKTNKFGSAAYGAAVAMGNSAPRSARTGARRNEATIGAGAEAARAPQFVARQEDRISEARSKLEAMVAANPNLASNDPDVMNTKTEMLAAGARVDETFKMEEDGKTFADAESRQGFDTSISQLTAGAAAGDADAVEGLARLDLKSMKQGSGAYSEMRTTALGAMNASQLKDMYSSARAGGSTEAQGNVKEIAKMATSEMHRIEAEVGKLAGAGKVDYGVLRDYRYETDPNKRAAAVTKLESAGMVDAGAQMRAYDLGKSIDSDTDMRAIRGGLSAFIEQKGRSAEQTMQRAGQGIRATAGAAVAKGAQAMEGLDQAQVRIRERAAEKSRAAVAKGAQAMEGLDQAQVRIRERAAEAAQVKAETGQGYISQSASAAYRSAGSVLRSRRKGRGGTTPPV